MGIEFTLKEVFNMNYTRKRISIHNIQSGMELASDVITTNGLLLITAHTVITQNHIFKLNLYQILSVDIKEYQDESILSYESADKESQIFNKKLNRFKKRYDMSKQEVASQLDHIGNGGSVNINALFSLSNNLLKELKTKSELFNYLNHLRSMDEYTYSHSLNVSMLCNIFGQWLRFSDKKIKDLTIAGLLHDIGKLSIDQEIINKPGKLTDLEFSIIKKHPELGYHIIKNLPLSKGVKLGMLMHHEKSDGSGYPLGFQNKQIHPYAKIIAIADIYDAMTSVRSYHQKTSPFKVIRLFEQESYGLLDTKYLFVFLEHIAYNYLHRKVRLTNGEEGTIIFIHPSTPSKPIVDLGVTIIDMQNELNLEIEEIM